MFIDIVGSFSSGQYDRCFYHKGKFIKPVISADIVSCSNSFLGVFVPP